MQPFIRGLGEVALTPPPAQAYYDEPCLEPFDRTLTGNQAVQNLAQYFSKDADFIWTGVAGSQTAAYSVKFTLPNGRELSSAQIRNANIVGTAQFPVPIFPAVRVPAGGSIGIALTDLSGSSNTIQLVFIGFRRYPVGR
jgi:hypothetical protein